MESLKIIIEKKKHGISCDIKGENVEKRNSGYYLIKKFS